MRFILLVVQICKGMARGVKSEVKKLKEQTRKNELVKQKEEEIQIEYKHLGEYVYYNYQKDEDERIQLISQTITQLYEEINQYKQELRDE